MAQNEHIAANAKTRTPPTLLGRRTNDAAEIAAMKMRFLVGDYIGFDIAEPGVGLVPDPFVKCLKNVFLALLGTWMGERYCLASLLLPTHRVLPSTGFKKERLRCWM
jgi:hypothetical protein